MPSWNIHTAHAERIFRECDISALGIADENAFLFGSYVPDVYVGFMVPEASFRIDYCITHYAGLCTIPKPDADRFWDNYVHRRRPTSPSGLSLVLGAWAHLVADAVYNERFRAFCKQLDVPWNDELRVKKQGDFDLFGRSLGISTLVEATPELLEAARAFRPYSILEPDARRAIDIANDIVQRKPDPDSPYRLLDDAWLTSAFDTCHKNLVAWLEAWQDLETDTTHPNAATIRSVTTGTEVVVTPEM